MIPIHQLLNRIRWDAEYGRADLKIGYYDRIENRIVVVTIRQVRFPHDNHFSIEVIDDGGESHMVPLHRVRQVHRKHHAFDFEGIDTTVIRHRLLYNSAAANDAINQIRSFLIKYMN